LLTHSEDVRFGEIHSGVIGGRPLETDVDPRFKSRMIFSKLSHVVMNISKAGIDPERIEPQGPEAEH